MQVFCSLYFIIQVLAPYCIVCPEHGDSLPDHIAADYCGSALQEAYPGCSKMWHGEEEKICGVMLNFVFASGRVPTARFQPVHREDISSHLCTKNLSWIQF